MSETEQNKNDHIIQEIDFTVRSSDAFYDAVDMEDFRDKDAETIYRCLIDEIRLIPFGDYLKRYIFRQMGLTGDFRAVDLKIYQDAIKLAFAENNTPKSFEETSAKLSALAKNWLTQGSVSRSVVFLLGFGLNMRIEDVSEFLTKALQEQDFNFKDPMENLCWYCYRMGYKYPKFQQLKSRYEETKKVGHGTVYLDKTVGLRSAAGSICDDDALIDFLAGFVEPPGKKPVSLTARETFLDLYTKSKTIIAGYFNADGTEHGNRPGQREWTAQNITEGDVEKVLMSGIPMDPNGNLVKISSSSLGKHFGGKRLSRQHLSEVLAGETRVDRFDLITLEFFLYSQDVRYAEDNKNRLFAFTDDANRILLECGMGELYVANPYECFLLMCMVSDCPLATFADVWELSYAEET
ncbi:hypothetical protein AGMMS49983_11820 [Clostridia bacterium]|nr:hypothetical protein AGMMS49983_11820 [Clostridia bacterium]